jgi:cytochrome c oxidase cbb3-type subunit 3
MNIVATMAATLLTGIVLLGGTAGCRNHTGISLPSQSSAAEGAAPPVPSAVGPLPGGVQPTSYRTNPFAHDPVAIQEGRKLFLWYNCYGCHGGHAGGGMGPSLRDQTWLYGDRDDQIFDSIAQGRGKGMPTWGTRVPEDQIWKLVAYIKTLQTPLEADAPTLPPSEEVPGPSTKPVVHDSEYLPAR